MILRRSRAAPGQAAAGQLVLGVSGLRLPDRACVVLQSVLSAFANHSSGNYVGATLAVGVAAVVGGFKLATAITRNANTMTLQHAMESGVEIAPDQLQRWASAKLIKTAPTSTP